VIGGLLAVATGSLLGRAARTAAAYVDLVVLTRGEALDHKVSEEHNSR